MKSAVQFLYKWNNGRICVKETSSTNIGYQNLTIEH